MNGPVPSWATNFSSWLHPKSRSAFYALMQTEYHIEDLVHQNETLVVYRVMTRDQVPLALVRLKYEAEIIEKLSGGAFEGGLAQLMQLNHNCLRPIVNGGLDPVDGFPWIVARWWDGIVLSDRVRDFDLTAEECYRIQGHANSLIEALGPVAGTVAFTPGSIVICGDGEQTIDTFSIDYHSWFAAFAEGIHPADLVDVQVKYKALTTYLRRQAGLSSTPLVSAVEAPSIQPEQSIILPSASNSSSLKILPILALLLGAIGYFGWKLANRDTSAKEKPIVLESKPEPVAPQITSPPTLPILPAKPVERLPQVEPVTEAIPELVPTSRPKSSGGFASVDPTSPYSLDKKIGKWITFETTLDQIDEEGRLIIPDSEIRATLPADSSDLVRSALRNKVTLRGFLASPSALKILKPDDIIVTYLLKRYYTIDDEFQIRKQFAAAGQIISVRAFVHEVTRSKASSTFYLQFKQTPPEFNGRVEKGNLDEAYLRSLKGKTIEVRGWVRTSSGSPQISITLTNRSQIKIIE